MKTVIAASAVAAVSAAPIKSATYTRCPKMQAANKPVAKSLLAKMANSAGKKVPGIGMDLEKIDMSQVHKDGYYKVACVNDAMRIFGDKHGDGKFKFKDSDVSIVWYDSLTPAEDRAEMTPNVCYNFCRRIEGMTFFGLQNGRGCYCTPYYKTHVGGEDEICDAPCDGDNTQMCGGKTKSDIYQMHWCGDVVANLNSAVELLESKSAELTTSADDLQACLDKLQAEGDAGQKHVATNGDKYLGDWSQAAKVQAGIYQKQVTAATKLIGGSMEATMLGGDLAAGDSKSPDTAASAEKVLGEMDLLTVQVEDAAESMAEAVESCSAPAALSGADSRLNKEYFPVQKWVAAGFEETSASCGGEPIGAPSMRDAEACAELCDKTVSPSKCMAFQHYKGSCVLLSKVTGVSYYAGTDCQGASDYTCMVKMSEAVGFTAPAEKQDRCFA